MSIVSTLSAIKRQTNEMLIDATLEKLPVEQRTRLVELLLAAGNSLAQAERLFDAVGGNMIELAAKQQLWERKLLDLSMRNSLLNMRVGKTAVPYQVADIAMLEDELHEGKEVVLENKELRYIYRAARTNMEEMGANTLFLTLGTLCWQEESGKEHRAPILLMPIDMVSLGKDRFAIRKRDEELVLNITLAEYLNQNYGIELQDIDPLPKDDHGVDVSLVLHRVSEVIREQSNWRVEEDSVLGIFSFTKFVMWNDIHCHPEVLAENPILRSLIEGRLLVEDIADPADARQMDMLCPPATFALPLDGDSSQIEAVADSSKGRTFCLYGPPGTGKSQSITNMLANAMYQGKRVLFVAQKKAALEVVQHRMAQIGLGDYCLELHSNKVEKKHFLDQLQRVLNLAGEKAGEEFRRLSDELYAQRMQLVAYVSSLHMPQATGLSLHDCIDRYLSIPGDEVPLPKDFLTKNKPEQIEQLYNECISLEAENRKLEITPVDHPLHDLMPKYHMQVKGYGQYVQAASLEALLPQLPKMVADIRRQLEGSLNRYANKTLRQLLEGDYQFKKFLSVAEIDAVLYDDIELLSSAVVRWNENLHLLPQWRQYCQALDSLRQKNLGKAADIYLRTGSGKAAADAFMKGYYHQVAMDIIAHDSALSTFDGLLFDEVIARYNALLQNFQRVTREHIALTMSSRIPVGSPDPQLSAELTLLRKRIASKGRGTTVRGILDQMPHLLSSFCPCMLMSPLSVAQYLDINAEPFDMVIFDEASQLPTCEAVGSIARAKAMIVVGDPQQMPPTDFFVTNVTEESEADIDDMESILDDCISLSIPSRCLSWHYRSNHESLIAFSNQNYYDGRLITFPSTDDMVSHVQYRYVNGIYDAGKTRTNHVEAEAVVAEVIRRMKENGLSKSIGIVSFNKTQADLIEDLLSIQLAKHPELLLQNQQSVEPIFVKNLENVQGDERDVIIFSVGYGPDKEGKISMNFGPLNQASGERRLNVAVSRSRDEMMIFSSLTPEQIDPRRTSSEGALGLKRFMEFARSGSADILRTEDSETPRNQMLQQITDQLVSRGYRVKTDVGTSSFRVDIAIVDPKDDNRYILGIICDGARYYGLKTTRDREVVQPSVLRRLGWNLMHVWSLDWLMHPEMVIRQIMEQINKYT